RPMWNARLSVVDRLWQPVPVGVAGEICIGGIAPGRGYWRRPDLTADRFVPDGEGGEPGSRVYRTGDLGRWRTDGMLDFLGRIDHQVKVRGFRIELGEIESALLGHPGVRETVVLAREDGVAGPRLVAYVVGGDGEVPMAAELRRHLRERLPEYMVPSAFVALPAMPLTANGKVDRRALPAPEGAGVERAAYVAPRDETERLLAGIWEDVLGVEGIGVEDDFFEIGGHSLLAVQVASRIRDVFGAEVPLRRLFEAPGLSALAEAVRGASREPSLALPPIERVSRQGELALSFAQERLWFLDQLDPGQSVYNMPNVVRLRGALSWAALARCIGEVVRRHEVLRTSFGPDGGSPILKIAPPFDLPLPRVDLEDLPETAREREARRLSREEGRRPFDLEAGPLLRAALLRLGPEDHLLCITLHHAVADDWSMGLFLRELAALYGTFAMGVPASLPALPIQYADFAQWQRRWMRGEVLSRELAFWRRHLDGAPPLLELPADRPRPAAQSFRGGNLVWRSPAGLLEGLHGLALRSRTTLFVVLMAALESQLFRYTGALDLVLGFPVAGRNRTEIENLIGLFVNTLPLRTVLSGEESFGELVGKIHQGVLDTYAHQDLPFEKLVEELAPQRNLGHNPLFQVMLVLQNAPWPELKLGDLRLLPQAPEPGTSKFDLTFLFDEMSGLGGILEYNRDLFDASTAGRMLGHFQLLLEAAVADPDRRISSLPLLTAGERAQLLEWNATERLLPGAELLHEIFAARAAESPEAEAVVFEGRSLTYAELDAEADRWARHLRGLGVGPEVLVGVCLERSIEQVIALLAILKAGGAYVPLDPEHPAERLAFVLEETAAPLVLTQRGLADRLPPGKAGLVILEELRENVSAPLEVEVSPDNLVYVIYTSGSTGRPKGAMLTHRGIRNRLLWGLDQQLGEGRKRVLYKTPLSFDVSVWEIFAPLLHGSTLVIARPGAQGDSAYLADLIREQRVTHADFVPSLLQVFLEEPGVGEGSTLERITSAGEALTPELLDRSFARLPAAILNVYGPTEASLAVTYWHCEPGSAEVPIGRPMWNARLSVV
ncbi:MAG: condensation domain-containing protein, partial [Thermoanaerobaculia bacterium]